VVLPRGLTLAVVLPRVLDVHGVLPRGLTLAVVLPRVLDLHGVLLRGFDSWWQLKRWAVRALPAPWTWSLPAIFERQEEAVRVQFTHHTIFSGQSSSVTLLTSHPIERTIARVRWTPRLRLSHSVSRGKHACNEGHPMGRVSVSTR
jgi:hypothetical protein